MIDEIDYFPRRDRHNKKKKVGAEWGKLKKEKSEQDGMVRHKKKKKGPPAGEKENDGPQT